MEESHLVNLCIEAASRSRDAVDKWRLQRRSLERLPSPLAASLLRRLHLRRLLFPSLLEVFKLSAEEVDLSGDNAVNAEWMAYLGAFHYLRYLNLADCHRINNSALWPLSGMERLRELDISRCGKVTGSGVKHLLSISTLEVLRLSETGVTANGVALLSSLGNLSVLDLGGLPVTDAALSSLQALTKLEHLDLWGSSISDKGVTIFQLFPKLCFLNLGWTRVTRLPNVPSLESLDLSNCTIDSLLQGDGPRAHLTKLVLSGATFLNEAEAFFSIEPSSLSFLDVSNSSLQGFYFLPDMKMLQHLDLSSSMMGDDSVEAIAFIGGNLINLNLSKTRISSAGLAILAEHVPKLEQLSLSHVPIDDSALSYIGLMPSLKIVDLSFTNVKGFIHQLGEETDISPSLKALQGLIHLQSLNLEQTQVSDAGLAPISSFQELSHLSLRSVPLTDETLYNLSSLPKLTNLAIRDAVLTNCGLDLFRPPPALKILDLRGCWLLTGDAISSFCWRHPSVDVRHEFINASEQSISTHPSPSRTPSRPPQVSQNQKQGKMRPLPPHFMDQRLKYSREELLALQYHSSLSIRSSDERVLTILRMQADDKD